MKREEAAENFEHQIARRKLDALVAEMARQLIAPVDNPLIAVEQLRGKVLHFPVRGARRMRQITKERLASIQNLCDELHLGLCQQPQAERWRSELVAYERAEHQAQKSNSSHD
jgi:hypothetical protein